MSTASQAKVFASVVPVTPVGPVAAATRLWRHDGALKLSLIAKASFRLMPEAAMRILPRPEPIHDVERHHQNMPTRSVAITADMAPPPPRAEVIFRGHAYALAGKPTKQRLVRLALWRGDAELFDKALSVVGDREGAAGEPLPEPAPFEKVPMVYERAYGGFGCEANPFGCGHSNANSEPAGPQPNILDPNEAEHTACFAPLSRVWPERKRLLGGMRPRRLDQRIVEIPEDFDFAFFHAAPADQRVDELLAGDRLIMEGLSPGGGTLHSFVPAAKILFREVASRRLQALSLRATTLRIDGDAETCSITWRGVAPLPHERALDGLGLLVALELDGGAVSWPEDDALVARIRGVEAPDGDEEVLFDDPVLVMTTFGGFDDSTIALPNRGPPDPAGPDVALATPLPPDDGDGPDDAAAK